MRITGYPPYSYNFNFFSSLNLFYLEDNVFTIVCWYLPYVNKNRPQGCIRPHPLEPSCNFNSHGFEKTHAGFTPHQMHLFAFRTQGVQIPMLSPSSPCNPGRLLTSGQHLSTVHYSVLRGSHSASIFLHGSSYKIKELFEPTLPPLLPLSFGV